MFLAQDQQSQTFCYSNADLRKGEQAQEIFAFIDFWEKAHGQRPRQLVLDAKLTTHDHLVRLDQMRIGFITLRRHFPKLLQEGRTTSAARVVGATGSLVSKMPI